MGERVMLELPETLARRARSVAQHTDRSVEAVLLEWLDRAATDLPVEMLPDDQVLALCDLRLSAGQQADLSDLLARQREGALTQAERRQLDALLTAYRRGMVRKAQAVKVAVDRGLRAPLGAR